MTFALLYVVLGSKFGYQFFFAWKPKSWINFFFRRIRIQIINLFQVIDFGIDRISKELFFISNRWSDQIFICTLDFIFSSGFWSYFFGWFIQSVKYYYCYKRFSHAKHIRTRFFLKKITNLKSTIIWSND